jgi:Pentapeptide repeats (8 copies)
VTLIEGRFTETEMPRLRSISSTVRKVDFSGSSARMWKLVRSRFIDCDFRGTDLSGGVFLLSRFDGSLIDDRTKLPISRAAALELGFRYVP